jgi:hypothetical protein
MSGTRGRAAAPEFQPRVLPDVVQPSGGGAGMMAAQQIDTIGDRILRLGERAGQRADQQAVEAATDAGLAAGNSAPGTSMEGGGDLYRRAYDRAALQGASWRLEATARTELDRMGREHAANPQGFAGAFTAWRDGTLEGMPEGFRARLAPTLDAMAAPYTRAIQDQNDRAVADERGAAFTAALPGRLGSIERLNLRAATDPAARAESDREQQALRNDLVALGPRTAFTFEGVQYPADPTRAGRYSLEQMAEIRRNASDTEAVAAARSAFRTGPQTLAAVEEFERRAEAGEIAGLRPDQARRIADGLRRDLSQARTAQTEGQREARAALAGRLDADRAAIAERGEPVSNILDTELAAAGYDVAQYRGQERARMVGWQATQDLRSIDTPERAQEVADRFEPGTPLFAQDPTTARQVLELARQRGASIRATSLDATIQDRRAELAANAARAAGPFSIEAAIRMNERHESGGRDIGPHNNGSSASGRLGITQGMWDTWAPRAGVAGRDRNDPEAQRAIARVFFETQDQWARQTLGRGITFTDTRASWFLGEAGWRAMVQAPAGADAFGIYSQAAGAGIAAQAFDNPTNRSILQRGRTAGEVMAALARQAGEGAWRQDWTPDPVVTREEAIAAGQTPEWAARVSAEAAEAGRQAAMRVRALTGSPAERAEIEAALSISGDRAAENARLSTAWREALNERATGIQRDPAGYVAQGSPVLQRLEQQVAAGDMAALPALVDGLRREQARQGVPEGQQRALPDRLVQGFFSQIADAPDPTQAERSLRTVVDAVGPADAARMFQEATITGGAQTERRQAIIMAAALSGRNDDTARRILRGALVLRDNTLPGQTTALMEARLDAHAGTAFAGPGGSEIRSQVSAAARAYYAAGLSESGQLASNRFDNTRFDEALAVVMPVARYGGQRVPLPAGMTERRFQDTMAALPPDRLAGAIAADGSPITPAQVARGGFTLQPLAPGRYMLRWGQYEVLDRDAGGRRPFILDLTGAAPAQAMGPPPDRAGRDSPARAVRPVEEPADMPPEPLGPPNPGAVRLRWEGGGTSQISNAPIGSRILGRTP